MHIPEDNLDKLDNFHYNADVLIVQVTSQLLHVQVGAHMIHGVLVEFKLFYSSLINSKLGRQDSHCT